MVYCLLTGIAAETSRCQQWWKLEKAVSFPERYAVVYMHD